MEPAGDALPPVTVKLVIFTDVPGGGTVLPNTLIVIGAPLLTADTLVSPTRSIGVTNTFRGTSFDWPSELVTVRMMGGTAPVKPGAGVKV